MPNPWLKKNPFMSMWLSTANHMAGSLRGQATAQVRRGASAAVTEATNEYIRLWTSAMTGPVVKTRARKR